VQVPEGDDERPRGGGFTTNPSEDIQDLPATTAAWSLVAGTNGINQSSVTNVICSIHPRVFLVPQSLVVPTCCVGQTGDLVVAGERLHGRLDFCGVSEGRSQRRGEKMGRPLAISTTFRHRGSGGFAT
jgi:hypothetical protein